MDFGLQIELQDFGVKLCILLGSNHRENFMNTLSMFLEMFLGFQMLDIV